MKTSRFLGAALVVAIPWLGCAKEPSRAPAQSSAAHAAQPERMGQTELQAPATADESSAAVEEPPAPDDTSSMAPMPPPAPDALVAVRPDGTPVSARELGMVTKATLSARSTMQMPDPKAP